MNYVVISLSNFRKCLSYVQSFKYLFAEYTFFADILK